MNGSLIDNVPLFADLTDAQRALIGGRMVLETRRAGELVYEQGEPALKMFLVKSGWVRLMSERQHILANISQGSLLGDADVLLGHNYSTGAAANSAVEVLALSFDALVDIVGQEPQIGLELSKSVGASIAPLIAYLVERRLRALPGLADVPDAILATLAGRLCVHTAGAGEKLYKAGQAPTSLFIVEQGRVTLKGPGDQVVEYEPGDLVGEPNLFAGKAHTTTAQATEPSSLWELSAADLEKLCAMYPDLRTVLGAALRTQLPAADQARAAALLQSTPIFQSLPPAALKELAARLSWQVNPSGTRVFEADTPASAMYLIEGGTVELLNQRNEPLAAINAGGYFGETGLGHGDTYGIAARTRGSTTLWVLRAEDVEKVAARYPALRSALMTELEAEKSVAEEHFAERYLRHLSLFAGLMPEQVREVAQHLRSAHFKASEAVYRRGGSGDALFLIEQGQVSVQTRTPESVVHVLASLGPGEFFGETALLTGEPHTADAFALADVDAWALTREDFESLLVRYPSLAINLSRILSRRLRDSNEKVTMAPRAAAAPVAVWERPGKEAVSAGLAPAPTSAPAGAGALTSLRHAAETATAWFAAQTTGAKLRVVALVLLVIWLLGVAAPWLVISLLSAGSSQSARSVQSSMLGRSALVAFAADLGQDAPTYTPWPTDTPIPTPTSTPTLVPTNTPVPTATTAPTETPVPPTATSVPPAAPPPVARVAAPAAPAPAVAAAAAAPKSTKQYEMIEWRHLSACDNGSKHNAFVQVVDGGGNPVDGVVLAMKAGDMGGPVFDVKVTGSKGPGKAEFDLYRNGTYAIFVTEDRSNPANTDITPQTGTVRDPNGEIWPEEKCDGGIGNSMGHNSFNIVFRKNF